MVSIYERLCAEELVESRRGSGTYVSFRFRPLQPDAGRPSKTSPPAWLAVPKERRADSSLGQPFQAPGDDAIDLRPGIIDPKLFPFDRFRRSMAKALRHMERSPSINGLEEQCRGDPRLRRAIADHAALMRAIACSPEQVVVTSGARQALDLLARTFVQRGKTVVAIEEPRYAPLAEPFEAAGATIRLVPVDQHGMMVEFIPDDANIVCVSPSSQYSLGIAMSANRRRQLHAFAKSRHCLMVEDDRGGELRTGGDPLQALVSLDPDSSFYVGTFSTSMLPSFRLGYMVAPDWALEPLVSAKRLGAWQSSSVMQAAAASFITDGYLSAHIAKMRTLYADRKEALVQAINGQFGEFLRPLPSRYGMHLAAIGNPAINWKSVAERARHERIHVRPLTQNYGTAAQSGLLFGVGAEPCERLRLAIERMAAFI
jgi:GntR family transcriptional regulator/MocR family aminotransferase